MSIAEPILNEAQPEHIATAALEARVSALESQLDELRDRVPEDRVSIVVFSGDLDKVLAAFVIATGAAALGQQVSMFFTFWGLSALKEGPGTMQGKTFPEMMMAVMSPNGPGELPVSSMNFFGVGARMLKGMMKNKNVASLEELMQLARDLDVRIVACEMSRDVMGVKDEELAGDVELGGVATFLGDALRSRATLFI